MGSAAGTAGDHGGAADPRLWAPAPHNGAGTGDGAPWYRRWNRRLAAPASLKNTPEGDPGAWKHGRSRMRAGGGRRASGGLDMAGIFDTPQRLAKLLGSVSFRGTERPLSPVEVSEWLREGSAELGGDDEVMKRLGMKKSTWSAYRNLLALPEDIRGRVCWGKPNPDTFKIGFSVAHYIAEGLGEQEQRVLVNTMWDHERPYTAEEIKRIKSYYKSGNPKSMEDAITHILKIDRPVKNVIYILISKITKEAYERLRTRSKGQGIELDAMATDILSSHFSEGAVTSVRIYPTATKVTFTSRGEDELDSHMKKTGCKKKDIIEKLLL